MGKQETMTRRGFLGVTAAFAAAGAGCATAGGGAPSARALDPEAIGFISDIHVGLPLARQKYKTMRDYPHQPAASQALVREILALPRPPANVLCLGDISLAFGETEDYAVAAETLKPLMDAGIKVTCAMGNHDIRAEFLKYFPGYDKATKVPGRFVSVVNTPHADFILLDSLVEPKVRGSYGACTQKGLGKEQLDSASRCPSTRTGSCPATCTGTRTSGPRATCAATSTTTRACCARSASRPWDSNGTWAGD